MMFVRARQDSYGITEMHCEKCEQWSSQEFAPGCHNPDCDSYVSCVSILRCGHQNDDTNESTTRWVCFDRELVERYATKHGYAFNKKDVEHLIYALTGWHRKDCHPGGWFWQEPWMKKSRTRILIKQNGGLDI